MKETQTTGSYYTIGHIAQFTGLTDRTIRSYIANGILKGEKINGVWHFTPEHVAAFFRDPAVKPSILAKKNAHVYDFMLDTKKTAPEICVVLDLPGADGEAVSQYFCDAIQDGSFHRFQFSLDSGSGVPRVILRGIPEEVLGLVNGWYQRQ